MATRSNTRPPKGGNPKPVPLAPIKQVSRERIGEPVPPGADGVGVAKVEVADLGFAISASDVLVVRAVPPEGFRRGGRRWSGVEDANVPVSDLTDGQLAAVMSEPMLTVGIRVEPVEDVQ